MHLFEPGFIGSLRLKNRIVMSPMHLSGMVDPDGSWGDRVREYYLARSRGGVGMITTGYIFACRKFEPSSLQLLDLYSETHLKSLEEVIQAVHEYGTKVSIQLTAGWGRVIHKRRLDPQVSPVSASSSACCFDRQRVTRALTTMEVEELAQSFGKAAGRCRMAGADAIELHGHEGYLLDQFMSGLWNKRTDKYGGSPQKRLSLAREAIVSIKEEAGKDFPVIYRFGIDHYLDGGRRPEESLWIARELEGMGVDALHVDAGCYENHYWPHPPCYQPPGCMADMAEKAKSAVTIPVIAVGKLHYPQLAESLLTEGKADFIALGRGLLADPDWPNKVKNGQLEDIRPCIADGEGCIGELVMGRAPSCTLNPTCGHEKEWQLNRIRPRSRSLLIVGGGPAGMEAARVAAMRGIQVTLWEKTPRLGGNLWPASRPAFKRDLIALIDYQTHQLKHLPVTIELNREATVDSVSRFGADDVILATGAVPARPEMESTPEVKVITAVDLLSGNETSGNRVLVLGGGLVGCETAIHLKRPGRQVTLIELLPDILSDMLENSRQMLRKMIADSGIQILTNTKIVRVSGTDVWVSCQGCDKRLCPDTIVVSTGMRPCNDLERKLGGRVVRLFAAGDCVQPRNLLHAIWEAFHTARNLGASQGIPCEKGRGVDSSAKITGCLQPV